MQWKKENRWVTSCIFFIQSAATENFFFQLRPLSPLPAPLQRPHMVQSSSPQFSLLSLIHILCHVLSLLSVFTLCSLSLIFICFPPVLFCGIHSTNQPSCIVTLNFTSLHLSASPSFHLSLTPLGLVTLRHVTTAGKLFWLTSPAFPEQRSTRIH